VAFALLAAASPPASAKGAKKRAAPAAEAKAEAKAGDAKAEAKPAEAAADAKTAEAKPADAKADAKTAEAKPADAKAATPAPAPVPDLPERIVEKQNAEYLFRVTLRPGNLKVGRVAEVWMEVARVLEIPDPTTGDRAPVIGSHPLATVQAPAPPAAPAPAPAKGKKAAEPAAPVAPPPVRYSLWPLSTPGAYGFHFTPAADGIYTIAFEGMEPRGDEGEPLRYEATFRIGAGNAAPQTELSQGSAATRRSSRRPVGPGSGARGAEDRLVRLMRELGDRFLDIEAAVETAAAKGPWPEIAAKARDLGAAIAGVKGLVPQAFSAGGAEFDRLAAAAPEKLEAVAVAAEGKDPKPMRAALDPVENGACLQCHAKYRFAVTNDVGAWPKFEPKPWKK